MPALTTPRSESPELSPQLEWPEFSHPAPATIIALIVTLSVVNTFLFIAWQLLKKRFARDLGSADYDNKHPDDNCEGQQRSDSSPTCGIESKTQRHFADERTPLFNSESSQAHVSLYDTFQIPPPHTAKLEFSRSMMELNDDSPTESGEGTPKAKTIHWHGVNRLNTAWGWMS